MSKILDYSKSKKQETKRKKLTISYKFVEHDMECFFLHGLSKDYYRHLTDALEKIQNITEDDLRQQKDCDGLKPKTINFNAPKITQKTFPIETTSSIYAYIKAKTRKEDGTSDEKIISENLKEFIKNSFELRLSTNSGRIHGFVNQNIFYIIWFDPAHNLYLSKHMGKETKIDLPHDVQKLKPICPTNYQEYNKKLQEIENYLYELMDEATS